MMKTASSANILVYGRRHLIIYSVVVTKLFVLRSRFEPIVFEKPTKVI